MAKLILLIWLLIPNVHAAALGEAAETYVLPITKVSNQGKTGLCSVYATLNTLETNFLATHPFSSIELSRAALQYFNWKDRYERSIEGIEHHLWEGSTTIDVIWMIRKYGLVAASDYSKDPKVVPWLNPFPMVGGSREEQRQNLIYTLDQVFGRPPTTTLFDGKIFSVEDFAAFVLREEPWEAYALASDGQERYGPHWDLDARSTTQAYYLPAEKFFEVIRSSLKNKHAVVVSLKGGVDPQDTGHSVQIYGATYDSVGKALSYFIKNSDGTQPYNASAQEIEPRIRGITSVKVF